MDDMDHGNTRSMGMRVSVVIVMGPMTLPMMGVIAAQSNWHVHLCHAAQGIGAVRSSR